MKLLTPNTNFGLLYECESSGVGDVGSENQAAHIANTLAVDVHAGDLKPGDMFPSERDLCDRFGVGRGIVREGMTILQSMGLADHSKGKRPRVAEPTLSRVMMAASDAAQFFFKDNEGLAHLQQARLFLETSMVRFAAENASNAQIAKMMSAIEECDANLSYIEAFRIADVKFHRALSEVSGNPIFVALHETFVDRLMKGAPIRVDFLAHNKTSNAGHKEILSAIVAKKSDVAEQALKAHLTRNYDFSFQNSLTSKSKEVSL